MRGRVVPTAASEFANNRHDFSPAARWHDARAGSQSGGRGSRAKHARCVHGRRSTASRFEAAGRRDCERPARHRWRSSARSARRMAVRDVGAGGRGSASRSRAWTRPKSPRTTRSASSTAAAAAATTAAHGAVQAVRAARAAPVLVSARRAMRTAAPVARVSHRCRTTRCRRTRGGARARACTPCHRAGYAHRWTS